MRRRVFSTCLLVAIVLACAPPARAITFISQGPGLDYVAFEAEDADSLGGGTRWRVIDLVTPYAHPNPNGITPILLPPGSNASGAAALLTDFVGGGDGTVVYQIAFDTPGTYHYYTRDGAYENGGTPPASQPDYGNEDSHYIPPALNQSPTVTYFGFASGSTEGQYGWRNGGSGRTFTVTTPGLYEFRISNRESGFSLDRIVFSQTTNLNGAQLDALANGTVTTIADPNTYFTNRSGDQKWATAGNWDNGVPGVAHHAHFTDAASGAGVTNIVEADTIISHLSYELGPTPASFAHTTQINGSNALVVSYGLNVAPANDSAASYAVNATITGANATLQVGNTGENVADMIVAKYSDASGMNITGNLNLAGLGTFVANLDLLDIAHGREWSQRATAQVTLAAHNTINANRIQMGYAVGRGTLLLGQTNVINTDLMHVGMGKDGHSEVRFQTGLSNPTLTLGGLSGAEADLRICHSAYGTGNTIVDTMDLSGGTFNATLDELMIGIYDQTYTGNCRGTLIMDAGTVTANSVTMAVSRNPDPDGKLNTWGTLTMNGGSFAANGPITDGDGISTINVNGGTFAINGLATGTREVDNYNQAAGGTLELRLNTYGTGLLATYTATFANGATVVVAPEFPTGSSTTEATTWTAGTGTWDDVTDAHWDNNLPAGFFINNGDTFTFLTATTNLIDNGLGCSTAGWGVTTTPGAGGSAVLTRTGAATGFGPIRAVIDDPAADVTRSADLTIAEAAGADAAMLDLQDGSLTVGSPGDNKNLTLGSGAASGVVAQTGGTLTVHGSVLDGGDSELQIDAGALVVNGGMDVDQLRVGYNGRSATATVTGGAVQIHAGDLLIGVRQDNDAHNPGALTKGTLDLSGASSTTLNVNSVQLATTNRSGVQGTLVLSPNTNTLTATTITIGDNGVSGNGSFDNSIILGTANTINTDTLYVGRRKSDGVLAFAGGLTDPTLILRGAAGGSSPVDLLRIGFNDVNTASGNNSFMDLSAGRVDALVNNMTIGRHHRTNASSGKGDGTLILSDDPKNIFDVNSIVLGQRIVGTNGNPTANGTITMGGGTFTVTNNITDGGGGSTLNINGGAFTVGGDIGVDVTNFSDGTISAGSVSDPGGAQFKWSRGILHVDSFGFDLANTGTGTLAPGHPIGTTDILGSYTQGAAATLEIEIDGPLYDIVTATGEAVLDGFLQLEFLGSPVIGMDYYVLVAEGGVIDNGMELLYDDPVYIAYSIVGRPDVGPEAQAVRLSYTPEPTTLTLLAVGGLGLLLRRRRNR